MTRLNNSNVQGLGAVVSRKRDSHVYPQIGHFFGNVPDRKGLPSPDGDKDRDPLLIDLFERGHGIVSDLKALDLKPQGCYRNQEPVNLYHKVGHGTLDMYVISPARDSKEVKEFLQKWHAGDQRLFAARESRDFNFPLQNLVSICALLVWQPANPDDTITRILFPGSTPDFKIQEGLEKLKHLEFMKHSTCTAKSIAPAIQTVAGTRKSLKSAIESTPAPPSAENAPWVRVIKTGFVRKKKWWDVQWRFALPYLLFVLYTRYAHSLITLTPCFYSTLHTHNTIVFSRCSHSLLLT